MPGGGRPWLLVNNRAETYCFGSPNDEIVKEMKSLSLDNLKRFYGNADRELGTKVISGKKARGFVIAIQKVNPEVRSPGLIEIWLDSETSLPIRFRSEGKAENSSFTEESSDIQWNIDLDPKLFDATPPQGYRDVTPRAPTSGDPVAQITAC